MKRKVLHLCLFSVFLLAFSSTRAEGIVVYVGVQGGLSNENASVEDGFGKIDFNEDSTVLYGGQVGIKFLSIVVEGQLYRTSHSLLASNGSSEDSYDLDYYYLGVNGKFGVTIAIVYAYLTAGYGTYFVDIKSLSSDTWSGSDKTVNIGAGVELSLKKVGVFAEVKYIDFSLDIEDLKWDFGGLNLHFGLNYRF